MDGTSNGRQRGDETIDAMDLEMIELAFAEAHARGEPLAAWIKRYPHHAARLIDLAIALDATAQPVEVAEDEVARIGSAMRSAVAALRQAAVSEATVGVGLLARAKALGLRASDLAQRVNLSADLVLKLDRGFVRLETVPRRLFEQLAGALRTTADSLVSGLPRTPVATAGLAFNAKEKPQEAQQQSFAEALTQSTSLPSAARATWLEAVREEGLPA